MALNYCQVCGDELEDEKRWRRDVLIYFGRRWHGLVMVTCRPCYSASPATLDTAARELKKQGK